MNKAVTKLGAEIVALLAKHHVDPALDRWEQGIEHHPMSEKIVRMVSEIDYMYFDYALELEVGGDGDNGELLMYELDVLFELFDKSGQEWIKNEQENSGQ